MMGLYTTEKKFDIFNHLLGLDTIHERDERTDWHRPTSSTAFIFIFIYQIYGRQLNRKKQQERIYEGTYISNEKAETNVYA